MVSNYDIQRSNNASREQAGSFFHTRLIQIDFKQNELSLEDFNPSKIEKLSLCPKSVPRTLKRPSD